MSRRIRTTKQARRLRAFVLWKRRLLDGVSADRIEVGTISADRIEGHDTREGTRG